MYVLSRSLEHFPVEGLYCAYPWFERDFDDVALECAWYPVRTVAEHAEIWRLPRDRDRILGYVREHRFQQLVLGGLVRCLFTFRDLDSFAGSEQQLLLKLQTADLWVLGRIDCFNRVILTDSAGHIYALVDVERVVKLAESFRGFVRHGALWFIRMKRYCFAPVLASGFLVSEQRNVSYPAGRKRGAAAVAGVAAPPPSSPPAARRLAHGGRV
ncbi:t28.2 [Tupaiid betaherpesvirus 1]|uniref:T28.2 n=1 Tax=Tupaiid herpesvirus 1 (strain 1) TaxID=10397 RepID=Q91TR8_TUHV1|nr:t28.2 [Tupaiid betaherpesvirus 1]AAK57069.1 t28.2 [Tupaiid betaherpesvirus 1]